MAFKAKDIDETTRWQDLTIGLQIHEPATSKAFETGEWRTKTPVFREDLCKQCLLCVPYCPDSSIPVKDQKRGAFDLLHCKGCGICEKACPFGAIEMIDGKGEVK
ncbi:MAG: 4Fe-4S binding protein [Clostridia bacterium]|nr:4Fe-4S binding protein [Clostridia bacterium]